MQNPRELYSYATLLATQPDLDGFPDERWQELKGGIEEEYHELLISDIANRLKLPWPKSGQFTTLTVSKCLFPRLSRLLGMSSIGEKKAVTILRVLTYLYENPVKPQEKTASHESSAKELIAKFPDEWRSIITQRWDEVKQLIPKEYHKKTIQELANDMGLKWPEGNWKSWTVSHCLTESFNDLGSIRGIGGKRLETIAKILIHLSGPIDKHTLESSTDALWSHPVISGLIDREREIFERRLLTVYEKPTLEELGQQYTVSRERIRQIEKDIKRKITASGLKTQLKAILGDYIKCKLLAPYTNRRYLPMSDVPSITVSLSPQLILAIALNYKSIYKLLSDIAVEAPSGWYFGKRSEFRTMTKKLDRELGALLPAPTECLADRLELEQKELIAVSRLNQIAVSEGVLMLPHKTRRTDANRAARCFETAISYNRHFWPIDELIEKSIGPLSPQNQRLFRISISRSPRLFISTPAYVSQLNHSIETEAIRHKSVQPLEIENGDVDSESDSCNFSILSQLLEEEWPITGTNIREYTSHEPYQIQLADSSLIAMLCSIPECTRLAPGIYGPKDYMNYSAKLKKARKLTMDERDIRAYCFARSEMQLISGPFFFS